MASSIEESVYFALSEIVQGLVYSEKCHSLCTCMYMYNMLVGNMIVYKVPMCYLALGHPLHS